MSLVQQQPWEMQLLNWANEAFNSQILTHRVEADSDVMQAAYDHCAAVTRLHSKTFYAASGLLPRAKRQAARALYAFCRVTDDIVDNHHGDERQRILMCWRDDVMNDVPPPESLVCLAWADTQVRFNIPRGYARQLIEGVSRDMVQTRYQTFDDLAEYSYGVASTVGLMAMHIVGFAGEVAIPYAIRLGVALQLTNILRDVGEDWQRGRLYLPQDELEAFNLTEGDIASGQVTDRWRRFMAFQIDRNRRLYAESRTGIAMLDTDGRFAITAAADLYEAILTDIEAHDYDVFSRRARISTLGKLRRMPHIWWRSHHINHV